MVRLLRHRQTKGPVSARLHLNRRATPRLHLAPPIRVGSEEPMSIWCVFVGLSFGFGFTLQPTFFSVLCTAESANLVRPVVTMPASQFVIYFEINIDGGITQSGFDFPPK